MAALGQPWYSRASLLSSTMLIGSTAKLLEQLVCTLTHACPTATVRLRVGLLQVVPRSQNQPCLPTHQSWSDCRGLDVRIARVEELLTIPCGSGCDSLH